MESKTEEEQEHEGDNNMMTSGGTDPVQAALRRDVSHLRFYVLSRAPKTLVREKLKEDINEIFFC